MNPPVETPTQQARPKSMPKPKSVELTAEERRLEEARQRTIHWKRWGPYLAERQWGTVREDYSPYGNAWDYFPHDHARSRAYRWGEDGLGGICDRHGEVCFALALWNGRDPILKERLFGLTGGEGNHGEDVKEYYFYVDSTPTHSYMKFLYKYPQAEFPYERLVEENRRRGKREREFELMDTGVFDDDRYFDVFVEYAKVSSEDILIRVTVHNRGPEAAELRLLPTLWFRNTWSWNGEAKKPRVTKGKSLKGAAVLEAEHKQYGRRRLVCEGAPELLITENETNNQRLYGAPNGSPYVKDGIHDYIVHGKTEAVNPAQTGTKASAHYRLTCPAGGSVTVRLRFTDQTPSEKMFGPEFDKVFAERLAEADEFYSKRIGRCTSPDAIQVQRQAFAGMLWSKQFFHYDVRRWLEGDPGQPPPPEGRPLAAVVSDTSGRHPGAGPSPPADQAEREEVLLLFPAPWQAIRFSGCRDGMNPRRSLSPPGCLPGQAQNSLGPRRGDSLLLQIRRNAGPNRPGWTQRRDAPHDGPRRPDSAALAGDPGAAR